MTRITKLVVFVGIPYLLATRLEKCVGEHTHPEFQEKVETRKDLRQ